jgi:hypothetical protein
MLGTYVPIAWTKFDCCDALGLAKLQCNKMNVEQEANFKIKFILWKRNAHWHFLLNLCYLSLRPCSVVFWIKWVERDWRGLRGILTCRGFNPPQSLSIPFVWGSNEYSVNEHIKNSIHKMRQQTSSEARSTCSWACHVAVQKDPEPPSANAAHFCNIRPCVPEERIITVPKITSNSY